uniref:60S ribosomal protein L34 n=1 Tax=Arundo donax TaxID=35708 RepID=A0A0A9DM63_ARUDO
MLKPIVPCRIIRAFFGRGAEDCEEGVEDPKDQGQVLQELDAISRQAFAHNVFKSLQICFSKKFSWVLGNRGSRANMRDGCDCLNFERYLWIHQCKFWNPQLGGMLFQLL